MVDKNTERFWEKLLDFIEDGRVIPVIGPELLMLDINGEITLLYTYLAEQLAGRLQINFKPTDTLNTVACRYLSESGQREDIYPELKRVILSATFSTDGSRVVTASRDNTARLWDTMPVISDNDFLLATLAETVAGMKLGKSGATETLDNQIARLDDLRQQTANAPLGEPTAESFTHWLLSDPWARTVSPLSKKTVPAYIEQQIAAGRRRQVEQEFTGHPLLRPVAATN